MQSVLSDYVCSHAIRFEEAMSAETPTVAPAVCIVPSTVCTNFRKRGYMGNLVSIHPSAKEATNARRAWTRTRGRGREPHFAHGDIYEAFLDEAYTWSYERNVAAWQLNGSVPLNGPLDVLGTLVECADEAVSMSPIGTLFSFTFVAAPGVRLRRDMPDAAIYELADILQAFQQVLAGLAQSGIIAVEFSDDERQRFSDLLVDQVVQCNTSDKTVLMTTFRDLASPYWTTSSKGSLMGCCMVKLRRTADFESIEQTERLEFESFPEELVQGRSSGRESIGPESLFTTPALRGGCKRKRLA